MKIITKNQVETQALAKKLLAKLSGGMVLGLEGNLGAGKTTFTQGLAKALGIKANVTSPTFVLLKIYPAKHKTIKQLVHIDAYRLTSGTDLEAVGWQDYLNKDSLVVVEWADKVKAALPAKTKWLKFSLLPNEQHQIIFDF
jgi:tRNA threonylcarbamoyladenosine biosynthesis protein TsaE